MPAQWASLAVDYVYIGPALLWRGFDLQALLVGLYV